MRTVTLFFCITKTNFEILLQKLHVILMRVWKTKKKQNNGLTAMHIMQWEEFGYNFFSQSKKWLLKPKIFSNNQKKRLNHNISKLTSYFYNIDDQNRESTINKSIQNKKPEIMYPCPGFSRTKNSELLQLHNKRYQKKDTVNYGILILYEDGK